MFVAGYVYNSNPNKPGFRSLGTFHTKKKAQLELENKLAGKNVTFAKTENIRAYADGDSTNYLILETKVETWILLDIAKLGVPKTKAVIATGSLADMKVQARKTLMDEVEKIEFERTGDNIEIFIDGQLAELLVLVRVF